MKWKYIAIFQVQKISVDRYLGYSLCVKILKP